ncbi:methylornithine synthase PylB [Desulfospira joergensenii]|uniref:methylornithine synthase PylB n=1 Tax=Desulfospira joergensenii TaxID=53329 RepID=UPI0003B741D5|nr:methylornithine synthase PylB [Desulfospira joergensenii]
MAHQTRDHNLRLKGILSNALAGTAPGREDIVFLLSLSDEDSISMLFDTARQIRSRHFGNRVFLYGFLYFSTECKNDCLFCKYRRSNRSLIRYRKSPEEILEAAEAMAASGVHLIDLTMGESAFFHNRGDLGFKALVDLTKGIKRAAGLPLMISPGVVPEKTLAELAAAGADWYACYQETYNRELFSTLRLDQSFDRRMEAKKTAGSLGMLVEEGLLLGMGETLDDVGDAVMAMQALDVDQARVMTFRPQAGTPMELLHSPDALGELMVIAVLRLVLPDRLIPASLDVDGLAGLGQRLDAGANVVTSLVVPGQGLAGVAHQTLDIEGSRRTPRAIGPVLEARSLKPASRNDYLTWMASTRNGHAGGLPWPDNLSSPDLFPDLEKIAPGGEDRPFVQMEN